MGTYQSHRGKMTFPFDGLFVGRILLGDRASSR